MAFATVTAAQTEPPSASDNGTFDPPGSHGVLNPDGSEQLPPVNRDSAPIFAKPPAFGAGKTGFDSTRERRKRQAEAAKKKQRQPLPPVATVPIAPVQRLRSPPPALSTAVTPGPITPVAAPPLTRPKPKPPELDPYAPLGIRVGAFMLRPAIEITGGYDSNPPRSSKPEGSPLYVIAPELLVKSDWERHEFRATLRGNYTGYPELPSLDRPSFESILDGRIDVTHQTRIELQGRYQVATDTPGSPNFQADVAKPTLYTNVGGTVAAFHRFNRLEIGAKVSADRTRYEESELTDGTTVNNRDRDFSALAVELRGSYELTPGVKPFVAVTSDRRVYDLAVDSFGVQRDSRGLTPRIGTTFELTRQLTGDVSVGYLQRTYEDPKLDNLSGIIADASLIWSATALTKATFTIRSTVYESTDPDVSGVLARDFRVQLDHSFREWLIGTLKFGYGHDEYVGTTRVDQRLSAAVGLTYKMNRNVQWKGEIRREQRSSNVADEGYTANIFLLGLRLQD
jgi:hypothetical protein